jgi:SAM-dependent methyltransferase
MSRPVDLFDSTYTNFESDVLARVRRKTFGEDFGQNSWTTADEYRRWTDWLQLSTAQTVVEVASGSGGPALFLAQMTGARVRGFDINAQAVAGATARAAQLGLEDRLSFTVADGTCNLPLEAASCDAVICIDSANHFPNRPAVIRDWNRILKPGGRLLFTDPVVITGLVTSEELAARSSIGLFVFAPPGVNERILGEEGFGNVRVEDVTQNATLVAARWRSARNDDREALVKIEGEERFLGLQAFFGSVEQLTRQRRLSRFGYLAIKNPST